MHWLAIFVGGGLGSLCRYGMGKLLTRQSTDFPWGTFAANFVSCFILGLIVGYFLKNEPNNTLKLLLVTGFCGGFSTFSTFTYETLKLLQNGQLATAFAYIGISLLLCLVAIFAGLRVLT